MIILAAVYFGGFVVTSILLKLLKMDRNYFLSLIMWPILFIMATVMGAMFCLDKIMKFLGFYSK